MPDDLDQIAACTSKDKEISCMRIAAQGFLDLQSQAIHAASHIGPSDSKPDPYARGDRDHLSSLCELSQTARCSSTSSTRRRAFSSKRLPTWTRYLPATSISIFSAMLDGCAAKASCSAVIVTGISRVWPHPSERQEVIFRPEKVCLKGAAEPVVCESRHCLDCGDALTLKLSDMASLSLGIQVPPSLIEERTLREPEEASAPGRDHPGTVSGIIPESWAASSRNAGRHQIGIVGGIISEWWAVSIGISSFSACASRIDFQTLSIEAGS